MKQNGNAIVMILIAVALFAALSLAFSNTSRTSSSFISDEEAKAYANQIIAYGNDVKSAVKRLQLRGCSDTEISFENNVVAGYTNPNSPADKSCHIFDVAGGGMQLKEFSYSFSTRPVFANGVQIVKAGDDCADPACTELLMVLRLTASGSLTASEIARGELLCSIINENLQNDSATTATTWGDDTPGTFASNAFQGAYNNDLTIDRPIIYGKKSYCGKVNSTIYSYHTILIAR